MDLNGDWYNELGSKMALRVKGSSIAGKYQTAVGDADGIYELVGRVSVPEDDARTLGFVVAWQNDKRITDSSTAWSGEAREIAGEETILTTWLLTVETTPHDDWKSTLVGKDVFTRIAPTPEKVKRAKALRPPSHHLKA
jgi:hypothetical protein